MADRAGRGGRALSLPRWYFLATVVVSVLLVAGAGIWYTNYAIKQQERTEREQDRRWCALLTQIDNSYQRTPPTTETGKVFAQTLHQLRVELGCP